MDADFASYTATPSPRSLAVTDVAATALRARGGGPVCATVTLGPHCYASARRLLIVRTSEEIRMIL